MDFHGAVDGSELKPSLFELVAQEQLRDLLQPALKYVLSVFAQRYPRYLLRLVNRHEEFYALLMFFVERHYLRTHNASFAENFYGLKRVRRAHIPTERARAAVGGVPPEDALRNREMARSLLWLVGLPYLRAKAQDYYEELGGGVDAEVMEAGDAMRQAQALSDQSLRGRWRRLFKAYYPWANMTFEGWLLLYNIAYLFGRTPFYRPWLEWVGVEVRRLSIDDMRAAAVAAANVPKSPKPKTLMASSLRLMRSSPRFLLNSLKFLLPTTIFFIKFLEWWYSPASPASLLAKPALGPAPPPPSILPPHPQGLDVSRTEYGQCAICRGPIQNATALPSGYVFCYRCAHTQVMSEGRCPVTLTPAKVWQLRKILA